MQTLPLEAEQLGQFFDNTETLFEIDYPSSLANLGSPIAVLTYIANLGMTCTLEGELDNQLLVEYMTFKSLTDIKNLQLIHANVLHYGKFGTRLYPLTQFGDEQTKHFYEENQHLVNFHMAFINSTQLYLYSTTFEPKLKEISQISSETHNEIGFSILRLFSIEDFMVIYMSQNPPLTDQIYFERYFDEKVFRGAPLMVYFHHPNNMYAGITMAVANLEEDTLSKLREQCETMTELTIQALSDAQFHQDQIPDSSIQ